jgi:hypothetical protein
MKRKIQLAFPSDKRYKCVQYTSNIKIVVDDYVATVTENVIFDGENVIFDGEQVVSE